MEGAHSKKISSLTPDNNSNNNMWRNSQPFYPPSKQLGNMVDMFLSPNADEGISNILSFLEQVSIKG